MACKGSGVRVPSAPLLFPQVRPLSRYLSMILPLTWAPYWAPSGDTQRCDPCPYSDLGSQVPGEAPTLDLGRLKPVAGRGGEQGLRLRDRQRSTLLLRSRRHIDERRDVAHHLAATFGKP